MLINSADILEGMWQMLQIWKMFANSQFNEDISKWNVSRVKNMNYKFCKFKVQWRYFKWNTINVENKSLILAHSLLNKNC